MSVTQRTVIVGVFADRAQAERAKKELLDAGCSQEQIKTSPEDLTPGKAVATSTPIQNEMVRDGAIGGGAGALLGTGAGFLARRLNPSFATRPLWLFLVAGAAIGSVLGGIPGLIIGKRMSSNEGQQNEASSARLLISVETDNPQDMLDIIHRNGAYEVHTTPLPSVQQPAPAPTSASAEAQTAAAHEETQSGATYEEVQTAAAFGGVQNPPYAAALETTQAPSLVVGAFPDQGTADTAIDALLEAGFTSEQIRYSQHGAAGGGIEKYLLNMGVPPQAAQMYEQEFELDWNTIVTVRTADRQQEALYLMETHGGFNIRQFSPQPSSASASAQEAMQEIKLREERLRVRKQQVQTGDVNIHRETVTEEKTITVPISREEMVIEYHTGATEGESGPQPEVAEKSETIRIPLSEEQVQVTKLVVPLNEVTINREQVQDVEHITETVKREELQVEQQGDVTVIDTTSNQPIDQGTAEQS